MAAPQVSPVVKQSQGASPTRYWVTYKIGKSQLHIVFGDISKATTDVIVTSDDTQLSMGGGTSKAILEASGEVIRSEAQSQTPLDLGRVVTTSPGNLKRQGVKRIFHAATIRTANDKEVEDQEAVIREATNQAISLLQAMKFHSIAMPALGTGFARFDARTVALAMTKEIREALSQSNVSLEVELWLLLGAKRDNEMQDFLVEFTKAAKLSSEHVRTHGVVLIHGIRTPAGWRDRVSQEIATADQTLAPIPIGYGLFDIVRFIVPGPWREAAAEASWNKMKGVFKNPNLDQVSVVAHSFGTWIIGHLLEKKREEFAFHRVLLCGAILDTHYKWDAVASRITGPVFPDNPTVRIINDCGTSDIWPIFARSATWGYDMSGRWGFQHEAVWDRFHPVAHSGFFDEGFAAKYWVPALTGNSIVAGPGAKIPPPWWQQALSQIKLPYLLLVVALAVLAVWIFGGR